MTDERLGYPSCSSLTRLFACEASLLRSQEAERRTRKKKSDGSAESGQRIHAALAGTFPMESLDVWETWIAERCIELERDLREQLDLGDDRPNIVVHTEKRLWWKDPATTKGTDLNLSGAIDKRIVDVAERKALVLDYKTGRVEVEGAADNWQLAGYGWLSFYNDEQMPKKLDVLYVAVIQPQADLPVTVAEYRADQMPALARRITGRLDLAARPTAKAKAGDHCRFCPARGSCPEALAHVETGLVPVDQVTSVKNGRKTEWLIPKLSPEEIVKYLGKKRTLKAIMEGLDAQAKQYAADGLLPGYELKDGDERITFTNVITAWKKLRDYASLKQVLPAISVSATKLDQIVTLLGIPAKQARAWWREHLRDAYTVTNDEPELKEIKTK